MDVEQEDKNQLTLDQVTAAAEDPKVTNINAKRRGKDKVDAEQPIVIEEDNLDELPF